MTTELTGDAYYVFRCYPAEKHSTYIKERLWSHQYGAMQQRNALEKLRLMGFIDRDYLLTDIGYRKLCQLGS